MNVSDILILAGLALCVGGALAHIFRRKGAGCSCGCEGCPHNCGKRKR